MDSFINSLDQLSMAVLGIHLSLSNFIVLAFFFGIGYLVGKFMRDFRWYKGLLFLIIGSALYETILVTDRVVLSAVVIGFLYHLRDKIGLRFNPFSGLRRFWYDNKGRLYTFFYRSAFERPKKEKKTRQSEKSNSQHHSSFSYDHSSSHSHSGREYQDLKAEREKLAKEREKFKAEQRDLERQKRELEQLRKYKVKDTRTPEEILGLKSSSFTEQELKEARRREALRWHPDSMINKPQELVKLAEEEVKKVNVAYDTLKKRAGF